VNFGATFATALVVVLVAFAIGVYGGKHRVIDVFWGPGFAALSLVGLVLSAARGPGYAEYIERTSGFFPLPPARPRRTEGA
jgi:steroid 5-alpha reductase family enzyme